MAAAIQAYHLAYQPIPKVACTSLKQAWFGLEFGAPYAKAHPRVRRARGSVHRIYPSRRFKAREFARLADYWTFAVVRDPAQRVLSAYSSKVLKRDMLTRHAAERRGAMGRVRSALRGDRRAARDLPLRPALDQFVLRLDEYRAAFGVIRDHTQPAGYYLGTDLSVFDEVFAIEDMPRLEAEISARSGKPFHVPERNKSPDALKVTVSDLSPEAFDSLMDRLAPEYELLARFYTPPSRTPQT